MLDKLSVVALVGIWAESLFFCVQFHISTSYSDLVDNACVLWWGAFFGFVSFQILRKYIHVEQVFVSCFYMRNLSGNNKPAQIGFCDSGSGIGRTAVSYTHLDVYKRQRAELCRIQSISN